MMILLLMSIIIIIIITIVYVDYGDDAINYDDATNDADGAIT